MKPIKICIIDDHQIVRQGLKELLHKLDTFEVIEEFDNGEDFLEALPLSIKPDIYILDYSMPFMTGIDVLVELEKKKRILGDYKVLLLTQHFDENIIDAAYGYGARGFLNKNCTAQELKEALENIFNLGYTNFSDILKRAKNFEKIILKKAIARIELNDKELEFLRLVCDERELTYEQMSEIMGMSLKAIEFYRKALFARYDIKSKIGLVLFSYKYRLTEPFI